MARITVTHSQDFVSTDTGYSAWVHVDFRDNSYAEHAGYHASAWEAKDAAKNTARCIIKAMEFCGRRPKLIDGNA